MTFCPKVRVNPIFVGFYNTVFKGVKSLSWPQKSPCWPANLIGNSQSISYVLPNNHRWRNVTENVQRKRERVWTQCKRVRTEDGRSRRGEDWELT